MILADVNCSLSSAYFLQHLVCCLLYTDYCDIYRVLINFALANKLNFAGDIGYGRHTIRPANSDQYIGDNIVIICAIMLVRISRKTLRN